MMAICSFANSSFDRMVTTRKVPSSAAKRSLAEQALDQVEKRSLNEDLTCGGVVTLGQPGDRTRFTSHDGHDGSSQYGDFSFCNYKIRVSNCFKIRQ